MTEYLRKQSHMTAKNCHSTNFIAKHFNLLVGFIAVGGARRCYILYGNMEMMVHPQAAIWQVCL